jgi:hypothetical protein
VRVVAAAVLGIGLAGCSVDLDNLPIAGVPPTLSAVTADIKKTADNAKLIAPLQVAGPIPANSISSVPWIICLRSEAPAQSPAPTYSLFFKENKLVSSRLSVIVDHCEGQVFSRL